MKKSQLRQVKQKKKQIHFLLENIDKSLLSETSRKAAIKSVNSKIFNSFGLDSANKNLQQEMAPQK